MNDRAQLAYSVFRGGFRTGVAGPPPWEELAPWIRDAVTVAYLQGTLDGKDVGRAIGWDTAKRDTSNLLGLDGKVPK